MIRLEIKKVFGNKQLLLVMLAVVLLHAFLVYFQMVSPNEEGYSAQDVGSIYSEMGSNQAAYLEDKIQSLSKNTDVSSLTFDEFKAVLKQSRLYHHIQEEVLQANSYAEYLEKIESEAQRFKGASLLFDANSFSSRNIINIAEDYSTLPRISLRWSPSDAMQIVTSSPLADICILLCIVMIVLIVTTSERALGYHMLIHTHPDGENKSWGIKLFVLLIMTGALVAVLYIPSILIGYYIGGFGDIDNPIQSMSLYYGCPYQLTVGQFLVVFLLYKFIAFLCVALILGCCGFCCCSTLSAVITIGLLLFCSYIPMQTVERTSWFGWLKEFNLAAIMDTSHYFSTSVNANLFGYPASIVGIGCVFIIMSLSISIPLSRWIWRQPTCVDKKIWLKKSKKSAAFMKRSNLFWFEMHKLFRTNHALVICISLIALLLLVSSGPNGPNRIQYYYQQYASRLSGNLSAESQQFIDEETERIARANEEIEILTDKVNLGELSTEAFTVLAEQWKIPVEQESAFGVVCEQYSYLKGLQERGCTVAFIDETGWKELVGEWGEKTNYLNAIWFAALLTLCLYNAWTMEASHGVETLIVCTPNGIRKTNFAKCMSALCLVAFISPILFLNQLILVDTKFSLNAQTVWNFPAISIYALPHIPVWCSVKAYLLLRLLTVFAEGVIFAWIILIISRLSKNNVIALSSCAILGGINLIFAFVFQWQPILSGRLTVRGSILVIGLMNVILIYIAFIYRQHFKCSGILNPVKSKTNRE